MLRTKEEIIAWLEWYRVKNYTINADLTVDVSTGVDLYSKDIKYIHVQFNVVNGNFSCCGNELKSLRGTPRYIAGEFDCSYNRLKDLRYAPKHVEKDFNCYGNRLISLMGAPKVIKGDFNCSNNLLKSLKSAPIKILKDFICDENELENIEFLPEKVGGNIKFQKNKRLENLQEVKTLDEINNILNIRKLKLDLDNSLKKINMNSFKKIKI